MTSRTKQHSDSPLPRILFRGTCDDAAMARMRWVQQQMLKMKATPVADWPFGDGQVELWYFLPREGICNDITN